MPRVRVRKNANWQTWGGCWRTSAYARCGGRLLREGEMGRGVGEADEVGGEMGWRRLGGVGAPSVRDAWRALIGGWWSGGRSGYRPLPHCAFPVPSAQFRAGPRAEGAVRAPSTVA
ncbi:hypothetical protein GCM10023324_06160 [Streptomyces youssoufiensis]